MTTATPMSVRKVGTAEHLAGHGYEAWTVDLRGHNESDRAADQQLQEAAG